MEFSRLDDMTKGWFVGAFDPTLYHTEDVEVAIKHYESGESEEEHFHKIATEITAVVFGTVEMAGRTLSQGDIVTVAPGEATAFHAVTDATTVVVKVPSASGDKYLVHSNDQEL